MDKEEETLFIQQALVNHSPERKRHKTKWKYKLVKTMALSLAFFSLGLCIAMPGPTLLDLGKRVNRDVEHMTFIFTARSIGYLSGSVFGGILFDFFDQQILLFYTLSAAAAATIGIPWCTVLTTLSSLICVQGLAIGVLNTGGNVFCIKIWGKKSAPFMQSLYFAFGIGAFVAPLIARPFLTDRGVVSGNHTIGVNHPFNFKARSIDSLSSSPRAHRDSPDLLPLHHLEPAWKYNNLNNGEWPHESNWHNNASKQNQRTNILPQENPMWNTLTKFHSRSLSNEDYSDDDQNLSNFLSLFRARRQTSNSTHDNNTETQIHNSTLIPGSTKTPVIITTRARKPDHNSGVNLDGDKADAVETDKKIQKINNNLVNNQEATKAPVATSADTVNSTSQADTLGVTSINGTRDWNNSVSETSTEETTTTPTAATTSSASTTTTVNAATTTSVSTTTLESSSAPTLPTAKLSTVSPTHITNLLVPATVGETLQDATNSSSLNLTSATKPETSDDFLTSVVATLADMCKIQFAYLVIGLLLALDAAMFLFLCCKDRAVKSQPYVKHHRENARESVRTCFMVSLHILLFCFFQAYMGLEVTFGGLLATFAINHPGYLWTPAKAALLTSVFWGCLAFGRGCGIFIARCFKPSCMMVTNLCLTVIGALILSFGVPVNPATLWLGTITLGLGMSSIFPTTISWVDSYYPLSGRATALIVAGSGVGEMTVPVLTGYLYEDVKPMLLMYITLLSSILLSLLYMGVQLLVYRNGKSNSRRSHSGFMRLHNVEDVDSLDVAEGNGLGIMENVSRRRVQREEEVSKENDTNTLGLMKLI